MKACLENMEDSDIANKGSRRRAENHLRCRHRVENHLYHRRCSRVTKRGIVFLSSFSDTKKLIPRLKIKIPRERIPRLKISPTKTPASIILPIKNPPLPAPTLKNHPIILHCRRKYLTLQQNSDSHEEITHSITGSSGVHRLRR